LEPDSVQTLVRGGWIVTDPSRGGEGVVEDGAVAIDAGGKIVEVGDRSTLQARYPEADREGGSALAVVPGFVDAHSHGMGLSYFDLGLGYDHLESWNMDIPGVQRPDAYLDTLWCGIKHLRSGCTTIHHMGDAPGEPVRGYRRLGIRWALSVTVKNLNLLTLDDAAFLETLPRELRRSMEGQLVPDAKRTEDDYFARFREIFEAYHGVEHPVMFGPMGPQWCTRALLEGIAAEAEALGTRIHMHAIQTPYQRESVRRARGMSPARYLSEIGILGSNLTLGHGVWFDQSDWDILADAGVSITHHASCNLQMRNGILPLPVLLQRKMTVAIGIDGKGINDDEDMLQEMRVVEKLHRPADFAFDAAPTVTPARILEMATIGGARTLGMEHLIGTLEPGKRADLCTIDMRAGPWAHPDMPVIDRIVMQATAWDVDTVMVDGRVLLRGGRVVGLDEDALCEDLVASIGSRGGGDPAHLALLQSLRPHVASFYDGWPLPSDQDISPYYYLNRRE